MVTLTCHTPPLISDESLTPFKVYQVYTPDNFSVQDITVIVISVIWKCPCTGKQIQKNKIKNTEKF